jgi:hypothetical protein
MQDETGHKTGRRFDPMFVLGAFFAASAKHFRDVLRVGYFAERTDPCRRTLAL